MKLRDIIIIAGLALLAFLALAYSGIFMHGDPIESTNVQ